MAKEDDQRASFLILVTLRSNLSIIRLVPNS